jgi:putative ABC transport system ATP-binding protein
VETIIQLNNVSKVYQTGNIATHSLQNVTLQLPKGRNIAIVGKSGSGKSTLLNMITGIDRPTTGEIVVCGKNITKLSEKELAQWRGQNIGIVFQFFQLLPTLNILDNLLLPMEFVGIVPSSERKKRAKELLETTGMLPHAQKYPSELSGGEQQRVAIARALVNDPPLIVADEPTGNLDSANSQMVKSIFDAQRKQGRTIVTVTHEHIEQEQYDAVVPLSDGKILNMHNL